ETAAAAMGAPVSLTATPVTRPGPVSLPCRAGSCAASGAAARQMGSRSEREYRSIEGRSVEVAQACAGADAVRPASVASTERRWEPVEPPPPELARSAGAEGGGA